MDKQNTETVAVVFSSSDYYSLLLGIVICSIFENKKGDYPIHIFIIDNGISIQNKTRLQTLESRYGFTLTYVTLDKELFSGISFNNFPIEVYQRLGIARILPPSYDRVVYLDCDMIVRKDLKELLLIDLGGKTVGAVADCYQEQRLKHLKRLCASIPSLPTPAKPMYFNSGMLVIDLNRWKDHGIEEKVLRFLRENPDKISAADQDALNIIFLNDQKELSQKYNFLVAATDTTEQDPVIIHFAGGSKPWYFFSALPYQSEYVYYANKTPWKSKKYRKVMDIFFAKKYHIYSVVWTAWSTYKKIKHFILRTSPPPSFLPNE